ncbi:MAG: hypothetical protein U0W24_00195 [Bacteroidales bacterium]
MEYLVRIKDDTIQAQSIINLLKTLAKDYDFLEIINKQEYYMNLSKEQLEEIDLRFEYVLKNPKEGKSWDEIERKIFSK